MINLKTLFVANLMDFSYNWSLSKVENTVEGFIWVNLNSNQAVSF